MSASFHTKLSYALSTANGVPGSAVDTDIAWDDETAKTTLILDMNGDGSMDVAFQRNGYLAIARWNNGFHNADVVQTDVTYSPSLHALDINGDGLDDIVKPLSGGVAVYPNKFPARATGFLANDNYQFTASQIDPQGLMLSSASSMTGGDFTVNYVHVDDPDYPDDPWSPPPPDPYEPPDYPTVSNVGIGAISDIDGDGRDDFLLPVTTNDVQEWFVAFSRATETSGDMLFAPLGTLKEPQLGDVNGDGLADLVYVSSGSMAQIRLSKGLGSESADASFAAVVSTDTMVVPYASDSLGSYYQYALVDVNLDGMQDLMFVRKIPDGAEVTKYRWKKALSTGTSFGAVTDTGLTGDDGTWPRPPQLGVLDQNGDGAIDIMIEGVLNKAGSGSHFAAGDKLSGVEGSNGLGKTISYAPLLSVHDWSGQGTVTDAYRLRPRREVVDSYTSDNGDGGTFTVEYTYSGGLMHRRGRGFLGFTSRTATDSRLPLRTKTKYRQDFPYTGMISFVETRDTATNNRVTYKQRGLTRQCFMEGIEAAVSCTGSSFTAAQEKRYHPYAGNVVEQTYAVNPASGALVRSVRTDRWTLDAYGNPRYTRVSHSGIDQLAAYDPQGIRTTTDSMYQNDTTGGFWCLGMPTQQAISATTGGITKYRTDTAAYLNCRLQTKTTGYGTAKPITATYTYDAFGNVETETLSAPGETSRVTTREWSANGRFLDATVNALGHRTALDWYGDTGLPKLQTDPNGLTIEWEYDALGNRTRERRPDGTETFWSRVYCSTNCGVTNGEYQVTETQQRTGVSGSIYGRTQAIVDALDRVLETRQPNLNATAAVFGAGWVATRTEYDALGRVHRQSMPFAYGASPTLWNVRSYDVLGRLTHENLANGGDRDYAYSGLVTTVTDPLNHQTEKETDAKGRVIRVTDAMNGTTTYHYDGFDKLTDTYAPGNSHIHIEYDDRGFKDVMNDPDMGSWDYDYNAFGELESQTDAKNQTVTLTYDALGRLKTRIEPEGTTTWTYDGPGGTPAVPLIGRLYKVSQVEGGVEKYAETTLYDLLGRPVNVTTTIDGANYDTSYEYDVYGRLASVEYPESFETFINQAPVANAYAPSIEVLPGSVTLDGSASTDDNFPAPLAFQWNQTAGPTIALSGAASAVATFTPTVPGVYGFTLDVTDSGLSDQAAVSLQVRSPAPGRPTVPSTSASASYTATWTAPSAGVTGSTTYHLQEATNSSFTSGLRTITASTTSASITGRTNTVTYYYRVRACEGSVCSSWSPTASTEIRLPPSAPGTLSATPTSTDTGSISVSWGAASGNITKYQLQEANGSFSNGVTRSWYVTSGTSKALIRTTPGTWLYRVRAYNDTVAGSYGNTDSVSVRKPATLATPTVSGIDRIEGTYTVSWNSGGSGVIRYELYRRFNGTIAADYDWYVYSAGTARTLSRNDVDEGTYDFRVRTCKATGCGAWSGILSFYVDRLTPKPGDECPPYCIKEWSSPQEGETADSTATSGSKASTRSNGEASAASGDETSSGNDTSGASSDTAALLHRAPSFQRVARMEQSDIRDINAANAPHALTPSLLPEEGWGAGRTLVKVSRHDNGGFHAMPPARPYDLARAREQAHESRAANTSARPVKTGGSSALVASASTSTGSYRFKVAYDYDTWSHLKRVRNAESNGTVYWEAYSANAMGQVVDEQFGNGVMTTHVYNPASGTVETITSTNASFQLVQALEYDWDLAGNLAERRDERVSGGLTEHFYYDSLNRLDYSTLAGPSFSGTNLDMSYDAAGNIDTKSGTGTYTYGGTRPHALTSLAKSGGGTDTFTYDANGNLQSGAGRTQYWTSYNYPRRIEKGATAVNFAYGPNRQRYKEERYSGGTLQTRTLTVGSHFEKVESPATGETTYKHFIRAGGRVIAVHDRKSDFLHTMNYLHRDHLGSVDTVTDQDGNVVARMSYDAFGKRRQALNWNNGIPGSSELEQIRDLTTRGYTDHRMLDDLNLIHMNGRVYDPALGRFISADPFIPNAFNTQSYNRYSYVRNNPLSFTDPSGFAENVTCEECIPLPPYTTSGAVGGGGSVIWRMPDSFCGSCGGGGGGSGEASEFTIGEKNFVTKGGTLEERLQIQADLEEIFSTPLGDLMLSELESRKLFGIFNTDFTINLTVTNIAYANLGGDAIYVDPNYHPTIQTTVGPIPASTQRIMAHELGHAVFGIDDVGPDRMMNVRNNENPIMNSLDRPSRTRYQP